MALQLSRNSKLWVSTVDTGNDVTNTWEIPLMDDFSFTAPVESTDITVNEAGPKPTRGSRRFNDAIAPVEWNFSTYIRPYLDTNHYTIDQIMWHALASPVDVPYDPTNANTITPNADGSHTIVAGADASGNSAVYGSATGFNVAFNYNSAHELTELFLFFKVDNKTYKIRGVQVNQAEISIDINDIGNTAWSGQALELEQLAVEPTFISGTAGVDYAGVPANAGYLKNKLTTMELSGDVSGSLVNYDINVTACSITINNNVTFLTPSTLGAVDTPIGSFTGTFQVTGSFDAYLKTGTNTSADLWKHLADSRDTVNSFSLTFNVGGPSSPVAIVNIPTAHLSIPEVNIEDLVAVSTEFMGIPATDDMNDGLEVNLEFRAP